MCTCYVHAREVQRTILDTVLQALSIFHFWDMVSHWLATETQESAYPYLPSAGITSSPQKTWLFVSSEDGISSLCLDGKHFGNWGSLFQSELYFKRAMCCQSKQVHILFSLHSGSRCGEWILFYFAFSLQHHHLEHRCSCVNKGTVLLLQGREVILSLVHSVESVRTLGRAWPPSEVWVISQHWSNKMSGWLSDHEY